MLKSKKDINFHKKYMIVYVSSIVTLELANYPFTGDDRIFFNCLKQAKSLTQIKVSTTTSDSKDFSYTDDECDEDELSYSSYTRAVAPRAIQCDITGITDLCIGRALLSGDLVKLDHILGLTAPPTVDKTLHIELHIELYGNMIVTVDFKNKCFLYLGLGWQFLVKTVYICPNLQHFMNVAGNILDIINCTSTLDITGSEIGEDSLLLVIVELSCTSPGGTVSELALNITGNVEFAGALFCTSLQILDISNCGLREKDVETLALVLINNPALARLYVSGNSFGDNGIRRLVEVLNQTSLQDLDVSNCGVGEEGLVSLGQALWAGNMEETAEILQLRQPPV